MRLIDADKLIEWIEYWDKNITKDINAPDVGEANTIIKDVLQTVVDYAMDADTLEWTPVSEGLPEDFAEVLVAYKDTGLNVPYATPAVFYKGNWYWWSNDMLLLLRECGERIIPMGADVDVTAWMPMPEPWKGEEE